MVFVQNSAVYAVACDVSIPILVMISSGYFRHLSDRLSTICNNPNLEKSERIVCIRFHQRLLGYVFFYLLAPSAIPMQRLVFDEWAIQVSSSETLTEKRC